MIEIKDPELFFTIQSKFERVPFTQSRAWYNYTIVKKEKVIFYVDDEKNTQIAFWGRIKKVPLIQKNILLVDTPLIQPELSEKAIRKRFLNFLRENFVGFEIDSTNEYDIEYEVGLRRAGFIRSLGAYKCPLSIEVDLTQPFNFDNNWRKNVKNAKKQGIYLQEIKAHHKKDAARFFCNLYKETQSKKGLKYSLVPDEIFELLQSPGIRLFYGVTQDNSIASAQIIYVNDKHCYSIFRVNSLLARTNNTAYLLYNDLLELLAQEKRLTYDMGRIPPSDHKLNSDSVYVFKNASRGRKIQYNGEWVFYKKKWVEYLMFIYKQFVIKRQRY